MEGNSKNNWNSNSLFESELKPEGHLFPDDFSHHLIYRRSKDISNVFAFDDNMEKQKHNIWLETNVAAVDHSHVSIKTINFTSVMWCILPSFSFSFSGMGGVAIAPPSSLVDSKSVNLKHQENKDIVMAGGKEQGLMACVLNCWLIWGKTEHEQQWASW